MAAPNVIAPRLMARTSQFVARSRPVNPSCGREVTRVLRGYTVPAAAATLGTPPAGWPVLRVQRAVQTSGDPAR